MFKPPFSPALLLNILAVLLVRILTGCRFRIQDIDGGFFEKFGSLLREHQDRALEEEYLPRTTSSSSVEKDRKDEEAEEAAPESLEDEQTLHDSDSEPEQTDKEQLISDAMGWNSKSVAIERKTKLVDPIT
uniref:Secreted protein n=1 Tax=Timema monikensis TaxID=170555 RepID=A0A7R9EAF8_9NEOP|nr:unnamed protein product [Timema monikensis]